MHGCAYEFGSFRLETSPRRLLREGRQLSLTPKALETLLVLVRKPGRMVTKRELIEAVWPDVHVEEVGLARNISALRKALGNDGERFIETWPRQGYRFVGEVTTVPPTSESGAVEDRPVIAVLPLKHLEVGPQDAYLGLGIADALIGRLSALRNLVVRPTNAVRLYGTPGQDPIVAGRALKVDCVLDGCIQRRDERIRVTVQLVAVHDAATLWAGRYDEPLTDIFTLEDSISERLAEVLALNLTDRERLRLTRHGSAHAEAHQFYLRGRYYWNRRTEDGLRRAIECFNRAVAVDPNSAVAYAGLADAYILLASFAYGVYRPSDVWPRARAATLRALELDDQLAEAHTSLAFVRFRADWDWNGAEREFAHAIELNPHYATARHWYSYLLSTRGRHDEALREIRCAQELDPLSPAIATGVGRFLYFAGRYESAVSECRKAIELDATFAGAHLDLGMVYEQLGRYDEALTEFQQAFDLSGGSPVALVHLGHALGTAGRHDRARQVASELRRLAAQSYVAPSDWAVFHLGMGDIAAALASLERAYEERTSFMVLLNVEPLLQPLHAEPRFQTLVQRLEDPASRQPSGLNRF